MLKRTHINYALWYMPHIFSFSPYFFLDPGTFFAGIFFACIHSKSHQECFCLLFCLDPVKLLFKDKQNIMFNILGHIINISFWRWWEISGSTPGDVRGWTMKRTKNMERKNCRFHNPKTQFFLLLFLFISFTFVHLYVFHPFHSIL